MTKFFSGFILGIVVSTVGVNGIFHIIDGVVKNVQKFSVEQSAPVLPSPQDY